MSGALHAERDSARRDSARESAAELDLLIKEARERTRRRRARNLGLIAGLGALLACGVFWAEWSSGHSVAASRSAAVGPVAAPHVARWPAYFVDVNEATEGNDGLQIRNSSTGRLTDPVMPAPVRGLYADPVLPTPRETYPQTLAMAATGPNSFVVALQKGWPQYPQNSRCSTQLYSLRLNAGGRAASMTPIGHALPGLVYSLAANAGGSTIGYAMQGDPCVKGSPGYIGVLDAATGRTRQWSDVGMYGVAVGDVALSGGLSMSANGRELVFPVSASPPYKTIRAYELRVLPTDAAVGTVAARSRIVLRHAGYRLAYDAALISPNGRSLYLCTYSGGPTMSSAKSQLVAYRMRGMTSYSRLASFTGDGGCGSAQLDPSGQWLLIADGITAPRVFGPVGDQRRAWNGRGRQHLVRINTRTGVRSDLTLWTPAGFGNMSQPTGMEVAW